MHTCGQFWNSEEVLTNQSLCRILHVSHVYSVRYVKSISACVVRTRVQRVPATRIELGFFCTTRTLLEFF